MNTSNSGNDPQWEAGYESGTSDIQSTVYTLVSRFDAGLISAQDLLEALRKVGKQ